MSCLDSIRRWLRNWLCRPARPAAMYLTQLSEIPGMSNHFRATVALPPLADGEAGEVTQRRFTKSTNGGDETTEVIPSDQLLVVFDCVQGDQVECWLYNIDDAGNQSAERSSLIFTVSDTTAPGAPGEMSVSLEELP